MIDIPEVKKRLNRSIDSYLDYASNIRQIDSSRYNISKNGKTYCVDMENLSCTCQDFNNRNNLTPCKHLIMIWLYHYFTIHSDVESLE